ncbi:MAG: exodeoxyribonuclease VII large subunit [Lysobacterales bacterium]
MVEFSLEPGIHVYTPSELNLEVRLHIEAGFPGIMLEAEISNLSRPASGHLYFSLKDDTAQVRCAMFRTAASRCTVPLKNGGKVLARGRLSLYEARGEYQFIIDQMWDAGAGKLQQQFELLKKKLDAEGLFHASRKKPLPRYPLRIGIITSPSGAAIQDILHVLQRRWPVAEVRLYPVPVQGAEAPGEICAALSLANRERWAETIILGRGGGSIEDLQAFNEESVARAVAGSSIPLISAVGHETDFSICDFVADLRAPTPSAAAELATPDQAQLRTSLARHLRLFQHSLQTQLQRHMQGLDYLAHRLAQRDPATRLQEQARQLDKLGLTLERAARNRLREMQAHLSVLNTRLNLQHPQVKLDQYRLRVQACQRSAERLLAQGLQRLHSRLNELGRTLHAVSPLATMGRGYAVLYAAATGTLVTRAKQLKPGEPLTAQLADGRLQCTVDHISAETLHSGFVPAKNQ